MGLSIETGRENEILRSTCVPIKKVDNTIKSLVKKMKKAMEKAEGVGLAAPQIGENIRVVIAQIGKKNTVLVNPEIEFLDEEKNLDEEGCLSVPGEFGKVWRNTNVSVKFLDEKGLQKKLVLKNFDARVVQHEIDHLDGVLFVDRMTEEHKTEMMNDKKNSKKVIEQG